VVVALHFNYGDWNVRLVVKDVVSSLLGSTSMNFPTDINAAIIKPDFFPNLCIDIPTRRRDIGRDEFGADIAFAEFFCSFSKCRIKEAAFAGEFVFYVTVNT